MTTDVADNGVEEIEILPPEAYHRFSVLIGLISLIIVGGVIFALSRATDSLSLSVWRTQMLTALATGNFQEAEDNAARLLSAEPTNVTAYKILLQSLVFNGTPDEAQGYIHRFLLETGGVVGHTLDALNDIAHAGRARDAAKLAGYLIGEVEAGTGFAGRTQQNARNSLGRLQDSGIYNAYSARGRFHAVTGDVAAATADYQAAISALPNYFFGYEQLMHYQFEQGDFDGAVATLAQGERFGALSQLFYVRVAEQYFFTGRPTEWVLMLLELSHKYDNITYFGWFVEGCVYRAIGRMPPARDAMQQWKDERPFDPMTIDQLLAECANPESKLFWHVDPLFESSPNYYGMDA